jgi:hypothetical protein
MNVISHARAVGENRRKAAWENERRQKRQKRQTPIPPTGILFVDTHEEREVRFDQRKATFAMPDATT